MARHRGCRPRDSQEGVTDDDPTSLLESERQAALTQVAALQREFADIAASAAGADDEHDPEGATIAFERQHLVALLEQARNHVAQVEQSLHRVADGSYGTCVRCGQPIPPARLAARPTATTCTRCAAREDRRR